MTNNTAISNYNDLVFYKPKELIAFYKGVSTPSIDTLVATFVRYRYEATEMHEVCKVFKVSDDDYCKIRNAVYDKINPLAQALNGKASITDERLDAAWQHIQELHFRNENYGNIIFGSIKPARFAGDKNSMWQFAVNKKDLTRDVVAKLLTVSNLYIMLNTSKSFARRTTDVANINALYLDIDNVPDVDAFINKCLLEGRFAKVEPSRIIASGGGLHIYFYLDNAYANPVLNKYIKRMLKGLHEIYPEADKLSDFVRFLRLDGSCYDKPHKALKTVKSVYESDKVYTVGEIGPMLVPAYVPREDKPQKTKVYSFVKSATGGNKLSKVPGTWRDLDVKRIKDIEYLLSIGHFDSEIRKRGVFYYALFVFKATQSFGEAAKAAHGFNAMLKSPLPVDVVENQICSIAKRSHLWVYKTETLVAALEIEEHLNDAQIANLLALIPFKEKRKRDYETRKKSRRNEKNLTMREASKEKNIYDVRTLLAQGVKQKDIAITLKLSTGRVSQIVKQIKAESK